MTSSGASPFALASELTWRGEARLAAASQGSLYIIPASGQHVIRFVVASGECEEIDLPRASAQHSAHALFVDPHAGLSLLVATRGGENIYVHRSRSRVIGKMKGVVVTAMAWLRPDGPASRAADGPREVLICSSSGAIYEAVIEPQRTRYLKQLLVLSPARPIHGVQVELLAASSQEERRVFVMVATATRCYEFVGGPSFESLFAEYKGATLAFVEARNTRPALAHLFPL